MNVPCGISEEDNESLKKRGKDETRLHLIVDLNRIGAKLFNVKLEHSFFPPRSGKNHLFEMAFLRWPDSFGLSWVISSFPIEYRSHAEATANECGLRFADGIPIIIDHRGDHSFPLSGPTVFTLENIRGHQIYENGSLKDLEKEEMDLVEQILASDRLKLYEEMTIQGYSLDQIDRIVTEWDSGDQNYDETPSLKK